MIRMGVKITGDRELQRKLKAMPEAAARGMERGMVKGSLRVQNNARQLVMKGPKSGVIYRRRGRTHQASAPGEAPATDTGTLVQNIVADPRAERRGMIFTISIVARTAYAFFLQFGTRNMLPRPFMDVALRNEAQNVIQDVNVEVRKELDNARS